MVRICFQVSMGEDVIDIPVVEGFPWTRGSRGVDVVRLYSVGGVNAPAWCSSVITEFVY